VDTRYYQKQFRHILHLRRETAAALEALGFDVLPSQANFIFAQPTSLTAEEWFHQLRQRNIVTRWFDAPNVRNRLRITIGTETEMGKFLDATRSILER
jgi:histidinol-phosphate aminotransferase